MESPGSSTARDSSAGGDIKACLQRYKQVQRIVCFVLRASLAYGLGFHCADDGSRGGDGKNLQESNGRQREAKRGRGRTPSGNAEKEQAAGGAAEEKSTLMAE